MKKGIEKELLDQYFEETQPDEFFLAQAAISQKIKQFRHLSELEKKEKIISFLSRRGFDYELIKKIIANFL